MTRPQNPKDVSAVIVTRGDQDLTQIRASLPFEDVVIWDNSKRHDVSVYGRYAALREVRNTIVYVQDDDCLVPRSAIDTLLAEYRPGEIVANMPVSRWSDYPDSCLVGWGAVFDRRLPQQAFDRYAKLYPLGAVEFMRDCDVVFTTLTPHVKFDLGFEHLPWAELPNRMFKQPLHSTRLTTLKQAQRVRDMASV